VLNLLSQNLEETLASNIQLSPNPASSSVVLMNKRNESVDQFEIFNLIGEVVMRERIVSENQIINIEHLSEGIYFLKSGGSFQRFQVVRK
jgi:hypothetical protein